MGEDLQDQISLNVGYRVHLKRKSKSDDKETGSMRLERPRYWSIVPVLPSSKEDDCKK